MVTGSQEQRPQTLTLIKCGFASFSALTGKAESVINMEQGRGKIWKGVLNKYLKCLNNII